MKWRFKKVFSNLAHVIAAQRILMKNNSKISLEEEVIMQEKQ